VLKQGPLSGQTLGGKYLLGELLGRGGFGVVYQAENQLLQRQQAVKVLLEEHFSEDKFRDRFLREARTLAALDHANIVHVDDIGLEGHLIYLVMPFISGGTLQDLLRARSGPLGLDEVMRYLEYICSALGYAHARGLRIWT
jgi:serine/threonine protein kinase